MAWRNSSGSGHSSLLEWPLLSGSWPAVAAGQPSLTHWSHQRHANMSPVDMSACLQAAPTLTEGLKVFFCALNFFLFAFPFLAKPSCHMSSHDGDSWKCGKIFFCKTVTLSHCHTITLSYCHTESLSHSRFVNQQNCPTAKPSHSITVIQ